MLFINIISLIRYPFFGRLDRQAGIDYTVLSSAGVAELADARDSNSRVLTDLWVRFPPPAPTIKTPKAFLLFKILLHILYESVQVDLERFLSSVHLEPRERYYNFEYSAVLLHILC